MPLLQNLLFRWLYQVSAYYSENLIRSSLIDHIDEVKTLKSLNPDSILALDINGTRFFVPIEYERSQKYSNREQKLISKYLTNPFVSFVFFISKTRNIEKRMMEKESRASENKFFYITLEDLLNSNDDVVLQNIKEQILRIS